MLPEPLHPAVVHFPIVLAVLLPIFGAGALWAIRRGAPPTRAWALPVALAAALTLSAYVALETGESQEDRVESVVGEQALHAHEEAAERFLALSGILVVLTAAGLLKGKAGTAARVVGTVGAAALVVAAVQVGDAGGKLVYQHGAASAYINGPQGGERRGAVSAPDGARGRSLSSADDDARRADGAEHDEH